MKIFKDKVTIELRAGKGGDGKVSFYKGRKPFGGTGGDGGDIYLEGSALVYDLNSINSDFLIKAQDGVPGGVDNLKGASGRDTIIKVPLTTKVLDEDGNILAIVSKDKEKIKLLNGGRGGLGNYFYRTKGIDKANHADEGEEGEGVFATFQLELYSDILLIGFPNAGKSSLLNAITNADSKVAPYAFTTLNPQLGRMSGITIMDLPGLIEGTYEGKGLGTSFVSHTKSAKMIAHLISCENEDVISEYRKIRDELEKIDSELASKPEIIVLTKTDLVSPEVLDRKKLSLKSLNKDVLSCSVYDYDSLEKLKSFLFEKVQA